jgi:hypothetical protein
MCQIQLRFSGNEKQFLVNEMIHCGWILKDHRIKLIQQVKFVFACHQRIEFQFEISLLKKDKIPNNHTK